MPAPNPIKGIVAQIQDQPIENDPGTRVHRIANYTGGEAIPILSRGSDMYGRYAYEGQDISADYERSIYISGYFFWSVAVKTSSATDIEIRVYYDSDSWWVAKRASTATELFMEGNGYYYGVGVFIKGTGTAGDTADILMTKHN